MPSATKLEYTVETQKAYAEAIEAVQAKAVEKGFRVLHTHDVSGTLAEKGFEREPISIVEVCNARFAHELLAKRVELSVMLPCPIAVYEVHGKTNICAMLPSAISTLYPDAGVDELAVEVERVILSIVNEAAV
jgi:uncharacterized protein (DUF302 family)